VAAEALSVLMSGISGEEAGSTRRVITPTLVERDSVAAPAG
jgi:DNA-binding LacI/PurR family transcriptional regulator